MLKRIISISDSRGSYDMALYNLDRIPNTDSINISYSDDDVVYVCGQTTVATSYSRPEKPEEPAQASIIGDYVRQIE